MILRSPAWIVVAGVVLLQACGGISAVGNALIGIDHAITATIDIKHVITTVLTPTPAKAKTKVTKGVTKVNKAAAKLNAETRKKKVAQ